MRETGFCCSCIGLWHVPRGHVSSRLYLFTVLDRNGLGYPSATCLFTFSAGRAKLSRTSVVCKAIQRQEASIHS